MRLTAGLVLAAMAVYAIEVAALEHARDRQDRAALDRIAADANAAASKQPQNADAQYEAALAESYVAEVAAEVRDRDRSRAAAEEGIRAAERAIAIDNKRAEYHRVLGTLCGQAVPGSGLAMFKYGHCALDSLNKAVELDPKASSAYLARGIGYSYLPPAFGGGVQPALNDIQKAVQLNPKSADAYLWLGIILRKANRFPEARQALAKSVQLNPNRIWAKQQLEKASGK